MRTDSTVETVNLVFVLTVALALPFLPSQPLSRRATEHALEAVVAVVVVAVTLLGDITRPATHTAVARPDTPALILVAMGVMTLFTHFGAEFVVAITVTLTVFVVDVIGSHTALPAAESRLYVCGCAPALASTGRKNLLLLLRHDSDGDFNVVIHDISKCMYVLLPARRLAEGC